MTFATVTETIETLTATVKFLDGSKRMFKGITSQADFESFLGKCLWKSEIKSTTYKVIKKQSEKSVVSSIYGPCGDGAGFCM
jgi:hypothetical protein